MLLGALVVLGLLSADVDFSSRPAHGRITVNRPFRLARPVRRRFELGRSALGRPIQAVEVGRPQSRRRILVVGCIHGDEPAGIAITRRLERAAGGVRADLWVVENLNPDGVAAHTRQDSRGVDLNRNFPWSWRPIGRQGDPQYSGPRALSEPEARAAHKLILRVRPAITIWFHQPLGVVDESGGDINVERRFARLSGLPMRRLTRYPGSAVGWQNHRLPGTTAFIVELPKGALGARRLSRYTRAVVALAR